MNFNVNEYIENHIRRLTEHMEELNKIYDDDLVKKAKYYSNNKIICTINHTNNSFTSIGKLIKYLVDKDVEHRDWD